MHYFLYEKATRRQFDDWAYRMTFSVNNFKPLGVRTWFTQHLIKQYIIEWIQYLWNIWNIKIDFITAYIFINQRKDTDKSNMQH